MNGSRQAGFPNRGSMKAEKTSCHGASGASGACLASAS